jgi:hypothetical protein
VNKGAKLEKPRSGTQPLPDPAEALRGPARVLRIEQHPPSPSMDPVRLKETVKPQGTPYAPEMERRSETSSASLS